jgi:DNA recombination protein RmuC
MEMAIAFGIVALLVVLGALVFALRGRGTDPKLTEIAERQGELVGRLAQMAEQGVAAQAQAGAQLQAQERALAKAVEERLAELTRRLDDSLAKSSQTTTATITDLRERLVKIDEAQKSITELSNQVVGLQDILSNKQARGAFGETQLEAIVSDQLPTAYFELQATLSNRCRVDCLIKLPPPLGPLAVDAKFPREAYDAFRAVGSQEPARGQAQRAFAASIQTHVRDIAAKYIIAGETAEAALMFVPSEAIYAEIFASAQDVADKARRDRVFIVSPTTLWAVLNTMRAILKDVRMREQAGLIQKEVATLLEDIVRLAKRVDSLEQHFTQAEKDVREIRTSTDKIVRRGERIGEVPHEEPAVAVPPLPPAAG